jgi:hypothetical protein
MRKPTKLERGTDTALHTKEMQADKLPPVLEKKLEDLAEELKLPASLVEP